MRGSFVSDSAGATEELGYALGRELPPGSVVCLYGGLGAGKTVFVRGLARAAGYSGPVTSPTFTIVNEYRAEGRAALFHFDMYRLTSEDDLYGIGWYDYLDEGVLCAVEWAERVQPAMPTGSVRVTITGSGEDGRRIDIE